jgi:hypothetical protein
MIPETTSKVLDMAVVYVVCWSHYRLRTLPHSRVGLKLQVSMFLGSCMDENCLYLSNLWRIIYSSCRKIIYLYPVVITNYASIIAIIQRLHYLTPLD